MQGLVWLLAVLLMGFTAGPSWARGGGGCLREGTPILAPSGTLAVEKLQVGDVIWGVNGQSLREGWVEGVVKVEVETYLELSTGDESILVTPEHPVMVGPGEFRNAGQIRPGDHVIVTRGRLVQEEAVQSVRSIPADKPAYNLLVNPGGTFIPGGIVVHNKGCFLPDNLVLKADGTEVPISTVQPGDVLLAFTSEGRVVQTRVHNVLRLEVDEHVVLGTDRETLRVTPDHPFYVGEGTFKTLEVLRVGDSIIAWDGQSLSWQQIRSMEIVPGRIQVYNLQTEYPHTFFVGHVAVHNKGGGGGGGCFPPGTPIATPHGEVPIETLGPGDEILAVTDRGLPVTTTVKALLVARNTLLKVETRRGFLEASPEHPVGEWSGGFRPMSELQHRDRILRWVGGQLATDKVRRVSRVAGETLVFNLQVDEPHTFIAANVVVHNKGGSSSSSSSGRSSSSSSGSSDQSSSWVDWLILTIWFGMFGGILFYMFKKARRSKKENLDFVYSASVVSRKAARTVKLLQFLSQQDPSVSPEALRKLTESTFRKLQECWGTRSYDPMKPLLMPSLFAQHAAQLRGMVHNHEINRIENLKVERVDLVNVRYMEKPNQREFTALISASARDYYVHETTGKFLRGDSGAARFQEFWTFQRQDDRWLLREIEQSGESDFLKDENFAEMLTDQQLKGIYGEAAGKEGAAGPWLEKAVGEKATRIERMLNFLAQTDKLWNRQVMQERARQVFLSVYLTREAGDPEQVPAADLFPQVAESLRQQIQQWQKDGITEEYRNLCVRKVELIHVRNFDDRAKDEYTVRISAHAQRIVRKGERTLREDSYVTDFEDHWTFGRLDEQWKLKEVLPPTKGKKQIGEENVDQDTSADQLKWYYRQTRAN
jgi:predicted lipid-binding transport protein (Tim44 family)